METINLCRVCGSEIVGRKIVKHGSRPTVYCSKKCGIKASTLRRAEKKPPKRQECPMCCCVFTAHRYQIYCCAACSKLAKAIRDFEAHHGLAKVLNSSQLERPPRALVLARAANLRARRGTADAIPSYEQYRRGRGERVGADPDEAADVDSVSHEHADVFHREAAPEPELAYADA